MKCLGATIGFFAASFGTPCSISAQDIQTRSNEFARAEIGTWEAVGFVQVNRSVECYARSAHFTYSQSHPIQSNVVPTDLRFSSRFGETLEGFNFSPSAILVDGQEYSVRAAQWYMPGDELLTASFAYFIRRSEAHPWFPLSSIISQISQSTDLIVRASRERYVDGDAESDIVELPVNTADLVAIVQWCNDKLETRPAEREYRQAHNAHRNSGE